jgi:hypothetical protein
VSIRLEIQRAASVESRRVRPCDSGRYGLVDGACPGCGANPFLIAGTGAHRQSDDRTLRAGGRCVKCGDAVGYIYATTNTLFGLEEDERVLNGRARVY